MTEQSKLYTILREPLLHFLLIGMGLFFIYSNMNDTSAVDENYINITKEDLEKIDAEWVKSKGRNPTEKERKELLNSFIQDEILYREAIAKGLDKNDNTIRTHLAKKMQFVFDDLTPIAQPTDAELVKFLSDNSEQFIESASISFNQVLFKPKGDSKNIDEEAKEFLKRLQKSKSTKISTVGDLVALTKKGLNNLFDEEFTDKLFNTPIKSWQGPISSKYGLHLVYVHSITPEHLPNLSSIKDRVSQAWRIQKQAEANKILHENLRKNYKIDIYNGSSK